MGPLAWRSNKIRAEVQFAWQMNPDFKFAVFDLDARRLVAVGGGRARTDQQPGDQ